MRALIYDVAVSLDGYIAGADADVSSFAHGGEAVEAYLERLKTYDTVVMGRHTYEFGYAFGLTPGERAYPHMDHHILSRTLSFPLGAKVEVIAQDSIDYVRALKARPGHAIYLCGGGDVAGQLLEAGLIDQLILKLNPIILGKGTKLFGSYAAQGAFASPEILGVDEGSGVLTLSYKL